MPVRLMIAIWVAVLGPLSVFAQETSWEIYTDQGREAYEQHRYAEAEELFLAALKEAEQFGGEDPRLHSSLTTWLSFITSRTDIQRQRHSTGVHWPTKRKRWVPSILMWRRA